MRERERQEIRNRHEGRRQIIGIRMEVFKKIDFVYYGIDRFVFV